MRGPLHNPHQLERSRQERFSDNRGEAICGAVADPHARRLAKPRQKMGLECHAPSYSYGTRVASRRVAARA